MTVDPISLSIPDSAAATGYSEATIRRAIRKGNLTQRYPLGVSKPVILATELREWIAGIPTDSEEAS